MLLSPQEYPNTNFHKEEDANYSIWCLGTLIKCTTTILGHTYTHILKMDIREKLPTRKN